MFHGHGGFETVRFHRGAPFRLDAHLERFKGTLTTLALPMPASPSALKEGLRALAKANRVEEGLARITRTAGNPDRKIPGTEAITMRALPRVPGQVKLRVSRSVVRTPGALSQCKTISRAAESFALREAQRAGAFDAILLNPEGRAVETTARNLFVVDRGVVRTPSASEGALLGITRSAILDLASKSGVKAQEGPVPLDALLGADEIFLTGSGVGVLAVAVVEDQSFTEVPGPLTSRFVEGYSQLLDEQAGW